MGWRDVWLRPWRGQQGSERGQTPEHAVARQTPAAADPAGDDAGSPGRRPDPGEAIYAEMREMAAQAAARVREEERENHRVGRMAPRYRLEYRRMRWEAVCAGQIAGMSPERIEDEYRSFRFAQWEYRNAMWIWRMSPAERQDRFRGDEMLKRFRSGLPPRDEWEREAYRERRQFETRALLDILKPEEALEMLWDEYTQSGGPLSREEFSVQYFRELSQDRPASGRAEPSNTDPWSAPAPDAAGSAVLPPPAISAAAEPGQKVPGAGAASSRPGPAGAGSGLEDGPLSLPGPDDAASHGGNGPDPGPPWLVRPGDPGAPGQARPGHGETPSGPVPR